MARSLSTLDVDLTDRRVLVVEDEWFIADEITGALDRHGARVIGPAADVQTARALTEREALDCAVLDVNLKGEMVFDFARELRGRGTPFVFATGYDAPMIPAEFADVARFEKPLKIQELLDAVARRCCGP